MKSTWLNGFIFRLIFLYPVTLTLLIIRKVEGDEFLLGQGIATGMLFGAMIDITVYVNAKQNALLFARLKATEQQQK